MVLQKKQQKPGRPRPRQQTEGLPATAARGLMMLCFDTQPNLCDPRACSDRKEERYMQPCHGGQGCVRDRLSPCHHNIKTARRVSLTTQELLLRTRVSAATSTGYMPARQASRPVDQTPLNPAKGLSLSTNFVGRKLGKVGSWDWSWAHPYRYRLRSDKLLDRRICFHATTLASLVGV